MVGIIQEIQKVTSWEGLNFGASCLLSGMKQLIDIVRHHDEGRRKQEFIEDEQRHIRQEQEEHQEQLIQLLTSIKSEIRHHPAQTDSTASVEGVAFLTPQNSSCQPPLHYANPFATYQGLKEPPKFPLFSGTDPPPKDEASFEQWVFQVQRALTSHHLKLSDWALLTWFGDRPEN